MDESLFSCVGIESDKFSYNEKKRGATMKSDHAAAQFEKACELLPGRLLTMALDVPKECMARVEEIRLRVGRPIHLVLPERETPLQQTRVTRDDLEYVVDRSTEFSRYTAAETLRAGYVTAEGGFRIGLCGTALMLYGQSEGIRDISSISIRIPRVPEDIARPIFPKLLRDGIPVSTMIISPPGGGKTTLLRDLVRLVSDGSELCEPMRVSLVDERGEIAAMYRGVPQLPVGRQTDVMDGCDKAAAIPMLLRSMSPQVIAVDEVALAADVDALSAAANCGVVLFATAHGSSVADLKSRPVFRDLLSRGVMERAVIVEGREQRRHYRVEEIL